MAAAAQVLVFIGWPAPAVGESNPSPAALLRGVEQARVAYDSMRVAMEIHYLAPPPERREFGFLIEIDGLNRRWETINGRGVPNGVIVRDGDLVNSFTREKGEQVKIDVAKDRGQIAFDPRILGLCDVWNWDMIVRNCLWYDQSTNLELIGQEPIAGVPAWHVRATRRNPDRVKEYWVSEPSFRVHRVTIRAPGLRSTIASEFGSTDMTSPFPTRVTVSRDEGDLSRVERDYVIKDFEFGVTIPKERFTLAGMDIPINMPVVDYRISRRVGYWDGQGLSQRPVDVRAPASPLLTSNQLILIGINVLVVIVLLVFYLRRRGRAAKASIGPPRPPLRARQ